MARTKMVRVKLGRPDRRECRKVSFLISSPTDIRLTVMAATRRVDRSALVDQILTDAVKGVVIEVPDVKAG